MKRKILEFVWNAIGMAAVGAAVGCAVNGQWAASCGLAALGVIALICWGILDNGRKPDLAMPRER